MPNDKRSVCACPASGGSATRHSSSSSPGARLPPAEYTPECTAVSLHLCTMRVVVGQEVLLEEQQAEVLCETSLGVSDIHPSVGF